MMNQLRAKLLLAGLSLVLTAGLCFGIMSFLMYYEEYPQRAVRDALMKEFRKPIIATNGPTVCEIHHRNLKQGTVVIQYGFRRFPKGYREAFTNGFIHANEIYHSAGCVRLISTNAVVLYCPACRQVKKLWTEQNKSNN